MRIGVLSDTHIPSRARAIPRPVLAAFQDVDLILHAGDLAQLAVLDVLRALAPVVAVSGNVDPPEILQTLPRRQIVSAGRFRIGLVHGDGFPGPPSECALRAFANDAVDAVVFGHSHQPCCRRQGSLLLFNPGSPTDTRGAPRPSFGLLTAADDELRGEIVYF